MLIMHEDGSIEYEQISFILKGKILISFQERPGDCFKNVRDRIIAGVIWPVRDSIGACPERIDPDGCFVISVSRGSVREHCPGNRGSRIVPRA